MRIKGNVLLRQPGHSASAFAKPIHVASSLSLCPCAPATWSLKSASGVTRSCTSAASCNARQMPQAGRRPPPRTAPCACWSHLQGPLATCSRLAPASMAKGVGACPGCARTRPGSHVRSAGRGEARLGVLQQTRSVAFPNDAVYVVPPVCHC